MAVSFMLEIRRFNVVALRKQGQTSIVDASVSVENDKWLAGTSSFGGTVFLYVEPFCLETVSYCHPLV